MQQIVSLHDDIDRPLYVPTIAMGAFVIIMLEEYPVDDLQFDELMQLTLIEFIQLEEETTFFSNTLRASRRGFFPAS